MPGSSSPTSSRPTRSTGIATTSRASTPRSRRSTRRREWLALLREGDMLVLTADHGCDPTTPGTDHTREYAPLLAVFAGHGGRRHDGPLADVGASVLRWLTGEDAPLPGSPSCREPPGRPARAGGAGPRRAGDVAGSGAATQGAGDGASRGASTVAKPTTRRVPPTTREALDAPPGPSWRGAEPWRRRRARPHDGSGAPARRRPPLLARLRGLPLTSLRYAPPT